MQNSIFCLPPLKRKKDGRQTIRPQTHPERIRKPQIKDRAFQEQYFCTRQHASGNKPLISEEHTSDSEPYKQRRRHAFLRMHGFHI